MAAHRPRLMVASLVQAATPAQVARAWSAEDPAGRASGQRRAEAVAPRILPAAERAAHRTPTTARQRARRMPGALVAPLRAPKETAGLSARFCSWALRWPGVEHGRQRRPPSRHDSERAGSLRNAVRFSSVD